MPYGTVGRERVKALFVSYSVTKAIWKLFVSAEMLMF